mmetsp:Transcript_76013/g.126613  ORF Transcript_76013/g.126613 Transcript_76013/m.126613 type:complete len:201 (-) Transcript_76013:1144-1746(-)
MRNDSPNATEVDGGEDLRVIFTAAAEIKVDERGRLRVKRVLKNGRGKYNFVVQRVKVGVHGLGGHLPLRLVLLCVELLQELGLVLKRLHLLLHLEQPIAVRKHQGAVVLPLVWVPQLHDELLQLLQGLAFGLLRQPVVGAQRLLHHRQHVLDQPPDCRLVLLREVPAHVDLPQQFPEPLLHEPHGALFPRLGFLLPPEFA